MYPVSFIRLIALVLTALLLAACGGDGKDGREGPPALVATKPEAAGANCPSGGWRIESGTDRNRDGVLSADEVQGVSYICHGEDGVDGQDGTDGQDGSDGQDGQFALTRITPIDAGEECLAGGHRIDSGIDQNGNDVLESDEIQHTVYVCHGADGEDGRDGQDGTFALVHTEVEPSGDQCPAGGIRVMSGVDANRNGLLDSAEVSRTSYVCHGQVGADGQDGSNGQDGNHGLQALLSSTQIPAGPQCEAGGYRLDTGLDTNHNGLLESNEITSSFYVCNGADGQDGSDGNDGADGQDGAPGTNGLQSLVRITDEAPGANCAAGGKRIQTGLDANLDGVLQASEVQQSAYLCNGEQGDTGLNVLVSITDELPGANCAAGGKAIHTGLDSNLNGVLDAAEIQSTSYVCHGTGGPAAESFRLQYSAQTGGTLVGTTIQDVLLGATGETVTAMPDVGYYFTIWSDGNTNASRTDSSVQADINVQAGFARYQYTLAYTAGHNGSITGIVGQTVFHGANGTAVQAVPNAGYHFVSWSDGVTHNPRTDVAVEANIAVSATFALNQYALVYLAGTGGSIMGNASQQVAHGTNGAVVAAVPASGYRFVRWSDGVTTTNRTDNNIQKNLQVTAEFREELAPPEEIHTSTSNGSLVVSWEPVPGADSYNLYYAREENVSPANYNSLLGGGALTNVSSPVTLSNLDGGHRYYFVVTTLINGEESIPGDEITLLLPNTPWLTSPHQGRLQVELTSSSAATLNWNVAFGESYNIYIGKNPKTDLSHYASYDAELRLNVTPPVTIENLAINEPVYLALETNGEVTDWTSAVSRTWGVNGTVNAQVIGEDGTRYVGGNFNVAGMNTGSGVAFPVGNGGQSPHVLAMPEVNGLIRAIASDEKGGWYIGGNFTQVGGLDRLRLAHIDGSGRVSDWSPGVDATVLALLFHEGTLYVGGNFNAASGSGNSVMIARTKLASFSEDGVLSGWNPHVNRSAGGNTARVNTMIVSDGILYVGGIFEVIGPVEGGVNRWGLAAFDISSGELTDFEFNSGANATNSLVASENTLYVAKLRNVYAIPVSSGGNNWSIPFSGGDVLSIALKDNVLYVGGDFDTAYSSPRNRLAALSTSFGFPIAGWNPGVNGRVESLTVIDDAIYAGGAFTSVENGVARHRLAAFSEDGSVLAWDGTANGTVSAVGVSDSVLYVGGDFSSAGGATRNNLSAFDAEGFLLDWNPGANNAVHALTMEDGLIYAGGDFTMSGDGIGTVVRNRLAAYDTAGNLTSWNPGANAQVSALLALDGLVYAGGSFTQAGGGAGTLATRNRLAAFNTIGGLESWNPGATGGVVSALATDNDLIYVGGGFTAVGGGTGTALRNYLAAFDLSGNVTAWSGSTNGVVSSLVVGGGTLYASGNFTSAGGETGSTTRNRLAAFDKVGNLTPWNPGLAGGQANSLAFKDNLIYAGGTFTHAGGGTGNVSRAALAAFSLSGFLTEWGPETNGSVNTLAIGGDVIYIGGDFSETYEDGLRVTSSRIMAVDEHGYVIQK